jgi:transcriptional regulator with XRE-family HTH domain
MSDANTATPYQRLGSVLKHLREEHRESMAEVSGAVEINDAELARYEAGQERPAEDILMLLISHFGIEDERAAELWQLAGYEGKIDDADRPSQESDNKQRLQAMMVMLDPRVMYSDSVEVVSNKQGVIINFSQTAGPSTSPLTIARIGMSAEQAQAVMGILHQALYDRDNPGNTRRLGDGDKTSD